MTAERRDLESDWQVTSNNRTHKILAERSATLKHNFRASRMFIFAWLLERPQSGLLSILAFWWRRRQTGYARKLAQRQGVLTNAFGLDMREWWTAAAG